LGYLKIILCTTVDSILFSYLEERHTRTQGQTDRRTEDAHCYALGPPVILYSKAVVTTKIRLRFDRRSTPIRLQFERDLTTVGTTVCGLLR